ncbi:MAG: cyclic nucleotide-binding domain-containing protein [Chloroflexi bacterium]|nr:cyclic nucleotide-binding domain-containing protein [Chloroflexota bacterium]
MKLSISAILRMAELFDNLTPTQIELIESICELISLSKGDLLFEENDSTDELYIIARGGIEILVNPSMVSSTANKLESVILAELRQGQVLGEVALVDQGLRSASAKISQNDTYLLKIPRSRLMLLCDTYPELGYKLMKNLAADLALKIRNTDLTVRQYQLMLSHSGL